MSNILDKRDREFLEYQPSRNFFLKIKEAIDKIDKGKIGEKVKEKFVDVEVGSEEETILERRVKKIIDLMQLSLDWKGSRYSGPLSLKSWENTDNMVLFPMSNKIWNGHDGSEEGLNYGASCGHCAWSIISSLISDTSRSWRSGRMSSYITGIPHSGKKVKGRLLRGYSNYFKPIVKKWTKGEKLGSWLHQNIDILPPISVLEFSHHVVLVFRFTKEFSIIDPLTNKPVILNIPYRCGADGNYVRNSGVKYYSGKKHVFRIFDINEKTNQRWKLYGLFGLNNDCQFENGPLANNNLLPIVLEGLEHIKGIPTLEDAKKAGLI